jgi:hypothetical protein
MAVRSGPGLPPPPAPPAAWLGPPARRSLFEWLSIDASSALGLLSEQTAAAPAAPTPVGGAVLSQGHTALAGLCLRDVATSRASRLAAAATAAAAAPGADAGGGDGGAAEPPAALVSGTRIRGPRPPEAYSLRHAFAHALEAAAAHRAAGEDAGARAGGGGLGRGVATRWALGWRSACLWGV